MKITSYIKILTLPVLVILFYGCDMPIYAPALVDVSQKGAETTGTQIYNAEDQTTDQWILFDNWPLGATVENKMDENGNRFIRLGGTGLQNGFVLRREDGTYLNNTEATKIKWKSKFDHDFIIYVSLELDDGNLTYLSYRSRDYRSYPDVLPIVLPENAESGVWETFIRDLTKDLHIHLPKREIASVLDFQVRGGGDIATISLIAEDTNSTDDNETDGDNNETDGDNNVTDPGCDGDLNDSGCDNNVTNPDEPIGSCITYKGLKYCPVTSSETKKVWLDRNLGAAEVCDDTRKDDTCYGEYYQWGRDTDGHQKWDSDKNTTQLTDLNNTGNQFIINNADWLKTDVDGTIRSANWSKTDGSSVCPDGYRVPTLTELTDENIDAANNFLRLPSAGFRDINGTMNHQNTDAGRLWSSSTGSTSYSSKSLTFEGSSTYVEQEKRAVGLPVRCIRN